MDGDHHDHGGMNDNPHAGHDTMDHSQMDHSQMDHSAMNHGTMNHSSMDHGMKMYFHVSNEATILFYSWTTSTAAGMFGSCIAVIILAALYEGLKVFRERLFKFAKKQKKCCNGNSQPLALVENNVSIHEPCEKSGSKRSTMCNKDHFLQTLLHIVQVGVSYSLMLIFMTYNVWLCLSVVAGAGLGYFLFGWMKTRFADHSEDCH